MDNNRRVRTFLKNYVSEKTNNPSELVTFLSPIAKTVDLLRHGGPEFIKTLDPEDAYHYSKLILDATKLSLGVDDSEVTEKDVPFLSDIEFATPAGDGANSDETVSSVRLDPERIDVQSEERQRWQSILELARRSGGGDSQQTPLALPVKGIVHSTPLAAEAFVPRLPSQSTPQRPALNTAQDGSVRYSSIPRRKPKRPPPLPAIRDDQVEHYNSDSSQASTVVFQVRDYARRSLEQIQERRTFDAPLHEDAALQDLPVDQDFIQQIEEMFVERRRTKNQTQRRREILPKVTADRRPFRAQNITVADRVSTIENYLFAATEDGCFIETVLPKIETVTTIQENVQYRLSASVDEIRAGELRSHFSSLNKSLLITSQQSTEGNLIAIEPDVIPEAIEPLNRSPQPQSFLLPEFVERLIDTDPIISPMELRPRGEMDYARTSGSGPRRKRRRRNREVAENVQGGQQSPRRPSRPTESVMPIYSPTQELIIPLQAEALGTDARPMSSLPEQEVDAEYYKRKFKEWRASLARKAQAKISTHRIDLTDVKKLESLCKETQSLLSTIITQSYLPIVNVIPPDTNRKIAVQRIGVLLELNTRGLIVLKRDANCSVVDVENLAFNVHQEPVPSTSQHMSKGAKESGFSEGMRETDARSSPKRTKY